MYPLIPAWDARALVEAIKNLSGRVGLWGKTTCFHHFYFIRVEGCHQIIRSENS